MQKTVPLYEEDNGNILKVRIMLYCTDVVEDEDGKPHHDIYDDYIYFIGEVIFVDYAMSPVIFRSRFESERFNINELQLATMKKKFYDYIVEHRKDNPFPASEFPKKTKVKLMEPSSP